MIYFLIIYLFFLNFHCRNIISLIKIDLSWKMKFHNIKFYLYIKYIDLVSGNKHFQIFLEGLYFIFVGDISLFIFLHWLFYAFFSLPCFCCSAFYISFSYTYLFHDITIILLMLALHEENKMFGSFIISIMYEFLNLLYNN